MKGNVLKVNTLKQGICELSFFLKETNCLKERCIYTKVILIYLLTRTFSQTKQDLLKITLILETFLKERLAKNFLQAKYTLFQCTLAGSTSSIFQLLHVLSKSLFLAQQIKVLRRTPLSWASHRSPYQFIILWLSSRYQCLDAHSTSRKLWGRYEWLTLCSFDQLF